MTEKDIKVGDIAYMIEHNVYGDPKGSVNEPKAYEIKITKIENGLYCGYYTKGPGFYEDIPEKYVYSTKEEAQNYIKERRDEIIRESFENHKKWFNEQIRRVRKI